MVNGPIVTLSITVDVTKMMTAPPTVEGPLANKALCYLMLEMAKDEIRKFADAQAGRIVAPA